MSLIRHLSTADANFNAEFERLRHWSAETDAAIEGRVADILADVRQRGDAAVLDYTARFDRLTVGSMAALEITQAELQAALASIPAAQREALQAAAKRVRAYHERQLEASGRSWSYRDEDGTLLGQKVTPLDRVGIYVPGGKAAYPSSVLMNAIPAHVAGVQEIIMVVPTPDGVRNPLVLAAAAVAGVHRAFTIGGAQAVAALAYGTATVPRVDKITGPGNAYVASAKKHVFGQVGIDMIAGPSEILVIADGTTPPDWVAMDLFSQAEHDELAQSILLSPDADFLAAVQASMERLLPTLPREAIIRASLQGRGALIHTRSMEEACEISNSIAPEHLEISAAEPARWGRCCAMPVPSSWVPTRAKAWATTAPAPTTCCPRPAPRASRRRWACTTSRSAAASSRSPSRARRCWVVSRRCWRMARACRPTRGRLNCA